VYLSLLLRINLEEDVKLEVCECPRNVVFPYLIKHTSSNKKIGYVLKVLFPHLKVLKSLTFLEFANICIEKN
jgi:hypothetical protein